MKLLKSPAFIRLVISGWNVPCSWYRWYFTPYCYGGPLHYNCKESIETTRDSGNRRK